MIAVGSTVKLKSGGPVMTVSDTYPVGSPNENTVVCSWFIEGTNDAKAMPFHKDALSEVDLNEAKKDK